MIWLSMLLSRVAYGQSKLANVLFTYELVKRLPASANCTVNTLHPGVVVSCRRALGVLWEGVILG
jgi:NAD(P)-dependent dehydrogenase (short-subunit alcohol dehydrogenase family)